ncbi:zinc finger, CCHC-type, retrotransposon gag domain protein [Tanacetum coccineum]
MATYRDFMTCDVPKFNGALDPIASTRWLAAVEGAFRTSNCKEKNKVIFSLNFFRDSAKMWWEGKVCEKGEEWIGACTWKEFKELFNAEFTSAKEIDRFREEFQTLMQTNETVNEMWKKFNDLIRYCPEYHGNEKLKVERFQRMLRDDIRENEEKKTKRKLEFGDLDVKKPKHDQSRRSGGTQIKTSCKKCHKTHLGVCRANLTGCYKCGALNHMSKDCKKPMILCYNCHQLGHKSNECPNPKAIEAKPLKSIKEENPPPSQNSILSCQANLPGALNHMSKDCKKPMILCYDCHQLGHKSNECPNQKVIEAKPLKSIKEEKIEKAKIPNPKDRVYMMATKEDKVVHVVVTCTILVNSIPARVLYDSGASVSFVSYEFSKNLSTPPYILPFPLEVEIPSNKVMVVSNVYREVEIEIDDSTFRIDLIPIML